MQLNNVLCFDLDFLDRGITVIVMVTKTGIKMWHNFKIWLNLLEFYGIIFWYSNISSGEVLVIPTYINLNADISRSFFFI